jgi:hypothetical protein
MITLIAEDRSVVHEMQDFIEISNPRRFDGRISAEILNHQNRKFVEAN